jgi:exosome complex component RRP46
VNEDGVKKTVTAPSPREIEAAQSVHVLAFMSHDELLLAESEGNFSVKEWDGVYETAKEICCRSAPARDGISMALDDGDAGGPDMRHFLRSTLESKVVADLYWK